MKSSLQEAGRVGNTTGIPTILRELLEEKYILEMELRKLRNPSEQTIDDEEGNEERIGQCESSKVCRCLIIANVAKCSPGRTGVAAEKISFGTRC